MLYRLIPCIGLLLAGCATASLQQQVDDLSKDLQELRRSHALTTQRIRELDRLNQTTFLIQDSVEHLNLEAERVGRTLAEMQTQMKVVNAALFDVTPVVATDNALPASARTTKLASGTRRTDAAAPNQEPINLDGDDRAIYQRAYDAMQKERTDQAVQAFEGLLQKFPTSDLADNAHYWLGEIFIGMGDVDVSRTHFQSILDKYPAGNKVPDAMYKLGVIAQDQGDCNTANSWYRKVQEQYPWAPVSEKVAMKAQECVAKP